MDPPAPDRLLRATAVLLDLDGVLYVEDEPIAGAVEAVAALRDRGLRLRFVTNTASRPRRDILARLERLGMPVRRTATGAPRAVSRSMSAPSWRRSGTTGRGGRRGGKTGARPSSRPSSPGSRLASGRGHGGRRRGERRRRALRAALAGVLVRTGKYRPEAVAASGVKPTARVDSIADVPALLGA